MALPGRPSRSATESSRTCTKYPPDLRACGFGVDQDAGHPDQELWGGAEEGAAGLGFAAPRLFAFGLAGCAAAVVVAVAVLDSLSCRSPADSGDAEQEEHAVAAE
ncbi:MAG TPA: hypothetical protein VGS06_26195 [Streptosporangiaceae bacterium]|nr:hypothetical protein [Streptosporangiaceae bacterium]